jgi:hypothetical protein
LAQCQTVSWVEPMPTFVTPTPLTVQVTHALQVLRDAREDGEASKVSVAAARLDRLLDRWIDKSTSLK